MIPYQIVLTDGALNAILETRLAGLAGGGPRSTTGNVVTLEQYGSFANGVADPTLDGPALTAAMSALAAKGGGTIECYQNYLISGNIIFSGDTYANISWVGKTPKAGFTHSADTAEGANLSMILFQGSDRYTLKNLGIYDLTFSGFSINDWTKCIGFDNCDTVAAVRCKFFNNAVEGLYFNTQSKVKNVQAVQCHAENIGGHGNLSAFNMNAEGSLLLACKALNCGQGVEQAGSNARILGNHFENCAFRAALIASTFSSYTLADGVTEVDDLGILMASNVFINCPSAIVAQDTTGHVFNTIQLKGNQGRILLMGNQSFDCAQFFSGGADSMKQVVIRGNEIDGAGAGGTACITGNRGRFLVEQNVIRAGATQWPYIFRFTDSDPVNSSALLRDNTIIGDAWSSAAFVLGPTATAMRNIFDGATPTRSAIYYSLCGTSRETDGDLSTFTQVGDSWFVGNDPDCVLSNAMPSCMKVNGSAPTRGTWKVGDRVTNIAGTGSWEWRCTVSGTADTINAGITATTTSGSSAFTITAGKSKVTQYQWVTIAGVPSRFQIATFDPATGLGTLSLPAGATVVSAAVAYSAPTWEAR